MPASPSLFCLFGDLWKDTFGSTLRGTVPFEYALNHFHHVKHLLSSYLIPLGRSAVMFMTNNSKWVVMSVTRTVVALVYYGSFLGLVIFVSDPITVSCVFLILTEHPALPH